MQIDQDDKEESKEKQDEGKVKDEEEDPFADNEMFNKMNESGELVCLNF